MRYSLEIYPVLTHRNIVFQVLLVHASKRSQIIPYGCPQSLYRIGVHFPYPISVIVSRPFSLPMIDGRVFTLNTVITSPFIRIASSFSLRALMNVLLKRFSIGSLDNSQPTLPTCAPDGSNYRRTVIVIVTVPALLVCSTSRRIVWVRMPLAFFPQHSGTSHQSRYRNQSKPTCPAFYSRSLVIACATCARSLATSPTLRPESECFHLCRLRAVVARLVERGGLCQKRSCWCKGCRKHCNLSCSDNLSARDLWSETGEPDRWSRRSEGNVNPVGGSVELSIPRIVVHSAGQ